MRPQLWKSRRRQRGAALVEAAVVIPTFILLLGGMLFLHHVLREQQRVMKFARNQAWAAAMQSCKGDGNGVPPPDFTSTMPGAPGSGKLSNDLGKASYSSSGSVAVSGDGSFGFSQSVSAHTTVFCNDQTEAGDIGGVFQWLLDNIEGLLGGA
jgi:hypothetical protein